MKPWQILGTLCCFSIVTVFTALSKEGSPLNESSFLAPQTTSSTSGHLAPNASFGACLMMKEDNDLLYEWLAYHYLVLPLRYLYIGSDLNNQQDPRQVLAKWRNTDLLYWVVNATEWMNRHGPYGRITATEDEDYHHHFLIYRQRAFITSCAEFLKGKGVEWVVYIDSDEFVVMNPWTEGHDTIDSVHNETFYHLRMNLMNQMETDNSMTVLDAIQRMPEPDACILTPRLRFGALETTVCGNASEDANEMARKPGFDYSALSTLRYKLHAGTNNFEASKFGKVMVDLSRIDIPAGEQPSPKNIHRPFTSACPYPAAWVVDSLFYLNHYTASWQRYSSRKDERRTCPKWMDMAYWNTADSCHQSIETWFPRFVARFGIRQAQVLLGGGSGGGASSLVVDACPPDNYNYSSKEFYKLQKKFGWNLSTVLTS